jgi:ribosomal protein S27E
MNATFASQHTATTISIACPWCDEPLALDDAFATTVVRCRSCATTIDLEPVGPTSARPSIDIAA